MKHMHSRGNLRTILTRITRWRVKSHTIEASKKRLLTASIFVMVGVLGLSNVTPALAVSGPKSDDQQVERHIKDVKDFIDRSADKDIKEKRKISAEFDAALEIKGSWWGGWWGHKNWKTCKAVEKLTRLLELIDRVRQTRPSAVLDELYALIWTLRNDIVQGMPDGKRCPGFENTGAEPSTSIKTSDNRQVSFNVAFGQPILTTAVGNGQTFTRVQLPGIENMVGKPGEPAVPMWRTLVAVPQGATARVMLAKPMQGENIQLNLVPFQEQAVDQAMPGDDIPPLPPAETFADKPFRLNEESYKKDTNFPESPCRINPMGQYRDVQMVQLECATAQYNPVTDRYTVFRGADVDIAFEGGKENFVTDRTFSAFESNSRLTTEAVLNKAVLSRYSERLDLSALRCSGEELLILTHQNFREAADRLATHKRNKGITTNVFNVGNGVPARDSAEEIDDFIENRYDECKVRPSYVMLMGDAEFIPTFYPAGMPDNAGTDFPYSNYVQILFDAFFPDFGTGRIPVDTLGQANTVVDKIVKYESSPPNFGIGNGGPFYTTVGLASQFQGFRMNPNGTPLNNQPGTDQRAFIETSEVGRQELVDRGYNVPRIYTRTIDNGGYCLQKNSNGDCIQTQQPYNGNTTPRRYFNGTALPAALGAGSGFGWNGSTANISSAWNEGRFLFVHRDHGWPGGWGSPGFSTSDVDALTNGDKLPVVWSINCASGIFDNETAGGIYDTTNSGVYFAERALRKADGGAIGVIGDTRNSPTWANNALTRGFFDAVWPDTVPTHGGNTSYKRLGDILNWGKIYLASQVGAAQTAGSVSVDDMGYEYNIWHVIGDPTLEMWTKNPRKLVLSNEWTVAQRTNLSEVIRYAQEGATITKLQVGREGEMRPIARGVVGNGIAELRYLEQPSDSMETVYAVSYGDSVSVQLKPRGGDPR